MRKVFLIFRTVSPVRSSNDTFGIRTKRAIPIDDCPTTHLVCRKVSQ
jgi:hypothetical protein